MTLLVEGEELWEKHDGARVDADPIAYVQMNETCYQANSAFRRNTRGFM